MRPTLLENCEEAIIVDKYLRVVGVIKDDQSTKESKDARRKSQATTSKSRDKEATKIDTLSHLVHQNI